jgi:hypothetical protein
MVIVHYTLNISGGKGSAESIGRLLDVPSTFGFDDWWGIELVQNAGEYVDFVDVFLGILEGKYDALKAMGIERNNIWILVTYEFNGQCNAEMSPGQLERLGRNGITLAISCWENPDLDPQI